MPMSAGNLAGGCFRAWRHPFWLSCRVSTCRTLAATMQDLVTGWLSRFTAALEQGAVSNGIFAAECYWRDLVAFTWNLDAKGPGEGLKCEKAE